MNTIAGFDRCLSFINCQLQTPGPVQRRQDGRIHGVTVSRQSGCGAHTFADTLAAFLQTRQPPGERPWTVFDRDLVEAVLQDHHLPARLASFIPEDRVGQINDTIEHLFGLHPPTEVLVRQVSQTVLHLAQLGNVIILGRGGNVVTAELPWMLHVRLIGSIEERVAHIQHFDHLDREAALARIKREDGGRRRYLRQYFGEDVDNPLLYDFVIKTDQVGLEDAAAMVGTYALNHRVRTAVRELHQAV